MEDVDTFVEAMIEVKRARLVEHNLSYEQLMLCNDIFSDDELTLTQVTKRVKQIKDIKAIKRAIKMREHLGFIQRSTLKACKEIVNTISNIDRGNR